MDNAKTYTAKKVAELFGVESTFIYAAATSGTLPSVKLGAKRVFPKEAIDEILARGVPVLGAPTVQPKPPKAKTAALVAKPTTDLKLHVQAGTLEPAITFTDLAREVKHTAQGLALMFKLATGSMIIPKTLDSTGSRGRNCVTRRQLQRMRAYCSDKRNRVQSRDMLLRVFDRFLKLMPEVVPTRSSLKAEQLELPSAPTNGGLTRVDLETAVEHVLARHETVLSPREVSRMRQIIREEVAAVLKEQRTTVAAEIVAAMNKRTRALDQSNGVFHRTPAPEPIDATLPPLDVATRSGKPGVL